MSFPVDKVLLPIIGKFKVYLENRFLFKYFNNKRRVRINLNVLIVSVFWSLALGLYFDLFRFGFLSSLSGNDFMWNWPLYPLSGFRVIADIPTYADFWGFWNLLAMFFFFVVYPIVFWLGIQIGYILFGRSEKQQGGIDLVFPRKTKDKDNFN